MDGYILLADGFRLDGKLFGAAETGSASATGWLAANTAVVGFQEMATDPAYRGRILAFTYPEIGNVGMTGGASESPQFQTAALVVKVLCERSSHYLAEAEFRDALRDAGVPCLWNVDTRALAVHLRTEGEMAAAIAPADCDTKKLKKDLAKLERPAFEAPADPPVEAAGSGAKVAVINLGVRRSTLQQLNSCCAPTLVPWDADADAVTKASPAGVLISDGPGGVEPPAETVETVRKLLGRVPILGVGLGHVVLGSALGCAPQFLKRGHHGANYPIRNLVDGSLQVTVQRHTALLERDSVESSKEAEVLWENINDATVEGIRSADGSAVGIQVVPAAPHPGAVNAHLRTFANRLAGK